MATAAKSINAGPIGVEPGPVPLPGTAEMFAAMVVRVSGDEAAGEDTPAETGPEEIGENVDAGIDASILLPMLDQQRAATPAAKLVGPAVETSSPVKVKIAAPGGAMAAGAAPAVSADPIPIAERIDGKGTTVAPVAPANDTAPDATPVIRPLPAEKAAPVTVTDKSLVMDPIPGRKPVPVAITHPAPVMRPLPEAKSAPITAVDKTPVMRPIDGAAPKGDGAQPATQGAKSEGPVANDAAPSLQVKVTQPATTTAQVPAELAPKTTAPLPAAVQPQAKPAETKAASPEVRVAAADAQAAPVAAKARTSRASAAPVSIEATPEAAGTTPAAATATETRAAVQPLHAAPQLAQPLAAPVGAPVQNVAAALSQQVLDMSGGDAWIDQIARDISQTAGKDGTMRFRLAPETLGELKVEITQSERGAHVRLNVSSESAQQALAAAEHKLTAEARAQGVRIAETEINFTGGQGQSRDASASAREQGQQQAQANQSPSPRGTAANSFTSSASAPEGRGRTDRYA